MIRRLIQASALLAVVAIAGPAAAEPKTGAPAPDFTGVDSNGNAVKLSEFKGQKVILEWTNHQCPYVQKHYETANMQTLQKDMADQGVVWLTVISSAPGKQGHLSGKEANTLTADRGAAPAAVVLDEDGSIGRLYGARTTPHMYVVDEAGMLAYMGAIDDNSSSRHSTVKTAHNYVTAAVADLNAGKPVAKASSRPYGCSVKY